MLIFPLLGLTAFSLMWAHYIASIARQYFELEPKVLKDYFELTSAVVLTAILLHPGLLTWQLWVDGQGLPPGSELNYVIPSARWAILLGFTALTVFLTYEFRRWFATKSWWKFAQYASDVAMVLIFLHALKLGGALRTDWFRAIWYFYGLSLLATLTFDAQTGAKLTDNTSVVKTSKEPLPLGFTTGIDFASAQKLALAQNPHGAVSAIELKPADDKIIYRVHFTDGSLVDIAATDGTVVRTEGGQSESTSSGKSADNPPNDSSLPGDASTNDSTTPSTGDNQPTQNNTPSTP